MQLLLQLGQNDEFYLQVNTRLQKVQYCRGVEVGVDLGAPEDVVYEALEAGP